MTSPKLDVRHMEDSRSVLRFAVYLRGANQAQGGQQIARFRTLDAAEEFVKIYPSLRMSHDGLPKMALVGTKP
jgi:hypothetical protein